MARSRRTPLQPPQPFPGRYYSFGTGLNTFWHQPPPEQKRRETQRKKGERHLTRKWAKEVLADVQKKGKKENERNQKAFERRAKGDGFSRSRTEQIQVVVGKMTETLHCLLERRKGVKKEGD